MKNVTNAMNRQILPVRLDGDPAPSSEFALMLALHVQPWEEVVAIYLAAREVELRLATAEGRRAA